MRPELYFVFFAFCSCTKLPANFKKCNKKQADFDQCFTDAVQDAVHQATKPYKEIGLPNLDPLVIPELTVEPGTGPAAFSQKYKNFKLYGIPQAKCSDTKVDWEKKQLSVGCFLKEFKIESDYEFNGKILLLSFHGEGPSTMNLYNMKIFITIDFEEFEKQKKKYYKAKKTTFKMEPESIHFNFENLLGIGDDQTLSKSLNQMFNENWQPIFEDVGRNYEYALEKVFGSIFNQVFSRVPIEDMFGKD